MKLPGDFYAKYWQQAPLFQPSAVELTALTPSVDQLWQWAQVSDSARLIEPDAHFQVTLNPDARPQGRHTLLVGQIEQLSRAWDDWSRGLEPIGRWSFADLMISHATKGASVGAHRDQYDVFLIQLSGQRQWEVGTLADRQLPEIDRGGSQLLDGFKPQASYTAKPGDLLYVPPGCGHHGVALDDDCMTLSVGYRQPSLAQVLERLAENLPMQRVNDLRAQPPGIQTGAADALRAQLLQLLQTLPDADLIEAWALATTQLANADCDAHSEQVRFASGVRACVLDDHHAAVMGERFSLAPDVLQALCSTAGFDLSSACADTQDRIEEFRDAGWLEDS